MKKIGRISIALSMIIAMGLFSLTSCGVGGYDKYVNADLYTAGSVSISAENIQKVEIDGWVNGSIEVEQTASQILKIIEEEGLENDAERMHYYIDGNVLKVRYCQSGLRGQINAEKKNLRLEVPAGLSLEIESEKAGITIGVLEVENLSIESEAGNITAERIVGNQTTIETKKGKVSIGELISTEASFESSSGDISVMRLSTNSLEVDVMSSDVSFGIQKAFVAEVESLSGDITFTLGEGLGATVRLQTATGKLKTEKLYGKTGSRYDIFGADGASTDCTIDVDVFSGNLYIL